MRVARDVTEEWLETKVVEFCREGKGRCLEYHLREWLNPFPTTPHFDTMSLSHPAWMGMTSAKRQNLICKTLDRMIRDRKIEIRNESGSTYNEAHTRYIYEVGVLDRLASIHGGVDG